jgi:hypothetical protein
MPSSIFTNPESVSALLEALAEQRGVGTAVLHRNPSLHVAVTDYLDGSNFDAFVTFDDRVVIYPGYRATVGALTRLTEHLAERLQRVRLPTCRRQRRRAEKTSSRRADLEPSSGRR